MSDLAYEKDDSPSEHTISSIQALCCSDTGRVMAVFYNDYDLDGLIEQMKSDKKEIESLKRMIDNGLGWEDLENDFKPFNN